MVWKVKVNVSLIQFNTIKILSKSVCSSGHDFLIFDLKIDPNNCSAFILNHDGILTSTNT